MKVKILEKDFSKEHKTIKTFFNNTIKKKVIPLNRFKFLIQNQNFNKCIYFT